MQTQFRIIIDTERGREVHRAADLSEAIDIYRHKLDEYPQSQIHLVRGMASTAPAPVRQKSATDHHADKGKGTKQTSK